MILKSKQFLCLLVTLSWLVLFSPNVVSHQFSTAHLQLEQELVQQSDTISYQDLHSGSLSVSINDLQKTLAIDKNQDGRLLWGEVRLSLPRIHHYLSNSLKFTQDGQSCQLELLADISLQQKFGELHLLLPLAVSCSSSTPVKLVYGAFTDKLNQHKLLLTWQDHQLQTQQAILSESHQVFLFDSDASSLVATSIFYIWQGVLHIWLGFDHLLFVFLLVIPFTGIGFNHLNHQKGLVNQAIKISPKGNIKPLLILITGFTLAHSLTLFLSVFSWISLPSQWVEASIAFSIVLTALNLIFKVVRNYFFITLLFGLLHGMGFAGALGELGLSDNYRLVSVLVFNIGVEVGQIIFILVCFSFLRLIASIKTTEKHFVPLFAISVAGLGVFWMVERLGYF